MAVRSRRAMGAAGGIGSALVKVGRGIGGAIGRVATSKIGRTALGATGIGGAVVGAVGSRVASSSARGFAGPGGSRIRPLNFLPGGKPLFERKKYRRMNPANAKALKRAIRRIDGFKKLAASVGFVPRKGSTAQKVHVKRRK